MSTDDRSGLFRREALEALTSAGGSTELLRPPAAWTWWIVLGMLVVVLAAALAVAFASVDVNVRAPAIVQSDHGVRPILSQVNGVIAFNDSSPSFKVASGASIATIDVAAQRSQLLENDRELQLLGPGFELVADERERLHAELVSNLNERAAVADSLVNSLSESLDRQSAKLKAIEELAESQLVGTLTVVDAREAYAQSERQLEQGRQSLAALRQEIAIAVRNRADELWTHDSRVRTAEARRAAIMELETQSQISSPIAGEFETTLRSGEAVQAGQSIGRVVPEGNARRVIAFLPEKDRAFVRIGDEVRLELSQLPYGEFGTLGARVVRISPELADPAEVARVLSGSSAATGHAYRIDLEIVELLAADSVGMSIKGGMLTQARFSLRRQRVASIILEPLRRWLN